MILDHVADRPRRVVEPAPPLDAEVLGHRDLNALDVLPVPDGLVQRIAEPEKEHVVHRALAEIVVDAEDPPLAEVLEQDAVEGARRREVAAERFLDNDSRARRRAARRRKALDHARKERRRNGEVVRGAAGVAQRLFQVLEGLEILIAAVDVAQQFLEPPECRRIDAAMMLEAVASALLQPFEAPSALGHADDGDIEGPALDHRLQRRKYFLVGEITRSTEEDQ